MLTYMMHPFNNTHFILTFQHFLGLKKSEMGTQIASTVNSQMKWHSDAVEINPLFKDCEVKFLCVAYAQLSCHFQSSAQAELTCLPSWSEIAVQAQSSLLIWPPASLNSGCSFKFDTISLIKRECQIFLKKTLRRFWENICFMKNRTSVTLRTEVCLLMHGMHLLTCLNSLPDLHGLNSAYSVIFTLLCCMHLKAIGAY